MGESYVLFSETFGAALPAVLGFVVGGSVVLMIVRILRGVFRW